MTTTQTVNVAVLTDIITKAMTKKLNMFAALNDALQGNTIPAKTVDKVADKVSELIVARNGGNAPDTLGAQITRLKRLLNNTDKLPAAFAVSKAVFADDTPRDGTPYNCMLFAFGRLIDNESKNDIIDAAKVQYPALSQREKKLKEYKAAIDRCLKLADEVNMLDKHGAALQKIRNKLG